MELQLRDVDLAPRGAADAATPATADILALLRLLGFPVSVLRSLTRPDGSYDLRMLEEATRWRWEPVIKTAGAVIMDVADLPARPFRRSVDGVPWEVGPIGVQERQIPQSGYDRWRMLAHIVPFGPYLWGEEWPRHALAPTLPPSPMSAYTRPNLRPVPDYVLVRPAPVVTYAPAPRDPCFIGVIPTTPTWRRGVWVLIAKWDE